MGQPISSNIRLNHPETSGDRLCDLLVLVLQKGQRVRHIVPLPLCFAALKSGSELICELFGMFVLGGVSIEYNDGWTEHPTFSIKDAKNLIILLSESPSSSSSALRRENMSTKWL